METSVISVVISKNREIQPFEEDECEDFLYGLYDIVSPRIAKRLKHLTSGEGNLADPEILVLWRQVSRSATLALLDCILAHSDSTPLNLGSTGWSNRCFGTIDFDKFRIETSLQQDDVRIAIEETAIILVEHLQTPRKFFYKKYSMDINGHLVR